MDQVHQSIALRTRPDIIVATPGRLLDHLSNTKWFSLGTIKYLVLDEADHLLNEDFEKSLDEILNSIPHKRRTYLFSATMTQKLPHMLPSEEAFVAAVSALGIENKDGVVVYDGNSIFSAARV